MPNVSEFFSMFDMCCRYHHRKPFGALKRGIPQTHGFILSRNRHRLLEVIESILVWDRASRDGITECFFLHAAALSLKKKIPARTHILEQKENFVG